MSENIKINELKNLLFVIPSYQRGYRWTEKEVGHLLHDLFEFVNGGQGNEYVLQPVVLQDFDKAKLPVRDQEKVSARNCLLVVDGQQRLTTLALLAKELFGGKPNLNWDIYYQDEKKFLSESFTDEKTINDYHRHKVGDMIVAYCKEHAEVIEGIKGLFMATSERTITLLRYDIDKEEDGHKAFLRLNANKTPLTSSELIRAFYMTHSNSLGKNDSQEQIEIAKEWEIIENTLRDEQFWLMFNAEGVAKTATRIDLLFAIVLKIDLKAVKSNPRIIFETLEKECEAKKNEDIAAILKKVWMNVLECYWWMKSCYADVELFNYLCWIKQFTKRSVKDIYDQWKTDRSVGKFKSNLIGIIQEQFEGFNDLSKFSYATNQPNQLRELFVLLNVLDCNKSNERFRFDLYVNESWDIEHIDSQTPNDKSSREDKWEWIEANFNEMNSDQQKSFKEWYRNKFPQVDFDVKKALTLPDEDLSQMIGEINEILEKEYGIKGGLEEKGFDKNGIGNLALLNSNTNRSYKNAVFPAKRKKIRNSICDGKCYVPPCTMKAFMKFYTNSASKILEWQKEDFNDYFTVMNKYFKDFIEIEINAKNGSKQSHHEDANACIDNKESTLVEHEVKCFQHRPVSFASFMETYNIVVPKIQRAYVQGRQDEYGKKCLKEFASELTDVFLEKKDYSLDFIYGIEGGVSLNGKKEFYPFDGQQRLTTLLLLSWLCGVNMHNWSFRYESRRVAECFIEKLMRAKPPAINKDVYDKIKIRNTSILCSDMIRASNWFMADWESDVGVAGMLAMLDSLYHKLLEKTKGDTNLIDVQSFKNITFSVNYLDSNKESFDQIFLKINSRGKELNKWENVKVVVDKFADKYVKDSFDWKGNLNNTWQEEMWKLISKDRNGDTLGEKMLSLMGLALKCAGYKKRVDDTYQLATWFEDKEDEENHKKFYEVCKIFYSAIDEKSYTREIKCALTPCWQKQCAVTPVSIVESDDGKVLVAYYAASKSTNEHWMRVVWNIVENCVRTETTFIKCIKMIDKYLIIQQEGASVLQNVKQWCEQVMRDDDFKDFREQVKEEIEKARIYAGEFDATSELVNLLHDAECCLHGRIRIGLYNLNNANEIYELDVIDKNLKWINNLFKQWNSAEEKSEIRKNIILNIMFSESPAPEASMLLSTKDDNLRKLLTTSDDEFLQSTLFTGNRDFAKKIDLCNITPSISYRKKGSFDRDWRVSLVRLANENVDIWEHAIKKYCYDGGIYAFKGANIKNAIPINDWRIEFWFKVELRNAFLKLPWKDGCNPNWAQNDSKEGMRMNDSNTYSNWIIYQKGKDRLIYFWSHKITLSTDSPGKHEEIFPVSKAENADVPAFISELIRNIKILMS